MTRQLDEISNLCDTGAHEWCEPGCACGCHDAARHEPWCHMLTGCAEPNHCTCEAGDDD